MDNSTAKKASTQKELEDDFMNINNLKSKRERWAWNEIHRLRDIVEKVKAAVE